MPLMANDSIAEITRFLLNQFNPGNVDIENFTVDMSDYAAIGKFLSSPATNEFKLAMQLVGARLENAYVAALEYRDGSRRTGAFSAALKVVASHYGFSDRVIMLNGKQSEAAFLAVVRDRCLFRDVYTSSHGEYTHALQWLLLAEASTSFGTGLVGLGIPRLYSLAVDYKSKTDFQHPWGKKKVAIWDLIVDCFSLGGQENYHANIFSQTLRCPQIFTSHIAGILPAQSWLEAYVRRRATKVKGVVTKTKEQLERTDPAASGQGQVTRYTALPQGLYEKNPNAVARKHVAHGAVAYKALTNAMNG